MRQCGVTAPVYCIEGKVEWCGAYKGHDKISEKIIIWGKDY